MGTTFLGWSFSKDNDTQIQVPLVFSAIDDYDLIVSHDYEVYGAQLDRGVFFKGDTAGYYTVVTLANYVANDYALFGATTIRMLLGAFQWSDHPVVAIAELNAASNNINIGIY